MQPAVPPEPPPNPAPTPTGSSPAAGWRWEATGALICVALFGAWLWLTDGNPTGFGQVLLAVLLGTGIGLALSGCRRGSTHSRRAARLALGFHLLITALAVGYAVRGWWFDRW
jgi:hypothetical protein